MQMYTVQLPEGLQIKPTFNLSKHTEYFAPYDFRISDPIRSTRAWSFLR